MNLVPENSICHEIDTGKHFYFGNGEWKELPPKGGSGGGSGGGLPADFPAEGSANANKFLGFDANGDYTAKDAPSGGGAEKFVVTLTQDIQTGEWTADKTVAEIIAADQAEKIVVATAMIYRLGFEFEFAKTSVFSREDDGATMSAAVFSAVFCDEPDEAEFYSIVGMNQGEGDEWSLVESNNSAELPSYDSSNNGQVLGVSSGSLAWVASNAPLVVTLTAGSTEGQFVGDKTHQEVFDDFIAGRSVLLYAPSMQVAASVTLVDHSASNYVISAGDAFTSEGSANDYITVTVGD